MCYEKRATKKARTDKILELWDSPRASLQLIGLLNINNRRFRDYCQLAGLQDGCHDDFAYLLGVWIGDGYLVSPVIAYNTDDVTQIEELQEVCVYLGLTLSSWRRNSDGLDKDEDDLSEDDEQPASRESKRGYVNISEQDLPTQTQPSSKASFFSPRNLGIKTMVAFRDAQVYEGINNNKRTDITFLPCDALCRVLSFCSIESKYVADPPILPHHYFEFYFTTAPATIRGILNNMADHHTIHRYGHPTQQSWEYVEGFSISVVTAIATAITTAFRSFGQTQNTAVISTGVNTTVVGDVLLGYSVNEHPTRVFKRQILDYLSRAPIRIHSIRSPIPARAHDRGDPQCNTSECGRCCDLIDC
ncbi:MAG: hypothetical protein J3R72DRAFT_421966 [Linnemannia gamsii]|nr:MAG: hypothetical protein J3R72DRAFT_421966 [Linnemannia gamsii]